MEELNTFRKFLQENEVHEGTWGYGSKDSMIKTLAQLDKIRQMGGVKGSLELDKIDDVLYRIFGDDEFHDAIDRAKDGAIDDDRFANAIGDAQARGIEMLKFHDRVDEEELEENDSVLDEIIGEEKEEVNESPAVFAEIDEMIETLATHMSAEAVLKELMSELQIISGGTKALHSALKNIMIDADLMEAKKDEE